MTIDANMYWLPEELFTNEKMLAEFMRCIPEVYGVHARWEEIPGVGKKQIVLEEPKGCENLNYVQGEYMIEKQLEDMDKADVEKAILKIPCCHTWLSLEMCRKFNDGLAEHVKKGNGRFAALAVVPPYGGKEAIYELEGYMDFERYGSDCMEHDGVVETEFGRLRRLEPPFPEQTQGQQMLQ